MMKTNSVRNVVAIGIGSALFLILSRFLAIPTPIANTTLQSSYAFLALMSLIFGPVVGGLIGLIGHTLADMVSFGQPWISWISATAVFGFLMGCLKPIVSLTKLTKWNIVKFNVGQIIVCTIAWGIVAPLLDIIIHREPIQKVFTQGAVAGISNAIIVALLGTTLLFAYGKTIVQRGSLSKDM